MNTLRQISESLSRLRQAMLLIVMMCGVSEVMGAITPTTPSKDASGVYQIGTAEDLWGFAQGVNNGTIAVSANAKLTCETSIDLGGSENGSFPGIGSSTKVYTGTFDGNGKTIKGYYQSCTSTFSTGLGFFKNVKNATIKNFTLIGTLSITGSSNNSAFLGGVIGKAETSQVIDVTSTVDINTDNTVNGKTDNGIRIVGGIAAWSNGSTFTRCRYNGTMTLYSKDVSVGIGDRFAGIVGFAQTGATTIANCLFDGKIEAFSNSLKIAGIMGRNDLTTSTITNCLSVGTLKLVTVNNTTGMIMGYSTQQPVITNSYYTKDKFTVNGSEVGSTGYNNAGTLNDGSDWESLTNTLNNNAAVGETANWKIVEGKDWPIPMEYTIEAAGPYTITFDTKGGTAIDPIVGDYGSAVTAPGNPTKTGYVFAGWDREIPSTMPGANITITAQWTYSPVDGYYLIGTKEDFFNFADVVSTNPSASAKLIDDIDLKNTEFSGFGKNATGKFYTGTFDGQGHTISNFTRTCTADNGCGFFNAIENATVKDFTLEGNITFSFTNEQYYNSSVVAYMLGTSKIEDVHSKVNATMTNGKTRLYGGILGRGTGTVNRCRYSGTVNASTSFDHIAGICASANGGLTISNCLFDGSITSESTNASLCMGGIVAKTNQDNNTLSNNLVKGTISPSSNSYAWCGVVIGYASHNISMDRCYYVGVGSLPAVGTPTKSTGSATLVDPSADGFKWLDILVLLNNGSTNWGIQTETYPVPGDKAAENHTITFDSNGGSEVAQISLPEGAAITAPEAPTWTGHTFTGWSPALPATMPGENLEVTAQWKLTNYAVKYYVDNILTYTDSVAYTENITPHAIPVKDRYTFSGWSETPETMPAEDISVYGTFTFSPNAETGIFEIANQEDLFNFATYVNKNDLGQDNGRGNANAKLIANITLDGTTPFPGIGQYKTKTSGDTKEVYYLYIAEGNKWTNVSGGTLNGENTQYTKDTNTYPYGGNSGAIDTKPSSPENGKVYCVTENIWIFDPSYAYTGTFDGQGFSITKYLRTVTSGNYGGFFNYVKDATITNFNLSGTMTINGTGQQYGSVVGTSDGTTLVEDVHSSVDVTISSTAAQAGGFVGRAGGTYNRCRYSGTVSSETAYNKIGGFAGNIQACTLSNSLFDGTITLSADTTALMASAFVASSFGNNPHAIQNCYVNGTINISHPTDSCGIVMGYYEQALTVDHTYYTGSGRAIAGAKGNLTGRATPVGTLTPEQLLTALNPTSGTDGNWEIETGEGAKTYPIPSNCTITAHEHAYNDNGFCYAEDGAYQPATKANDGRYEVSNAGQLWWMATNINDGTLPKTTKFRLTQDIDMEGDSHGQFPGICTLGKKDGKDDWEGTAFQGFFDGNNHTINNYSRTISASTTRSGLINAAYNATIRKININGTVTVKGNGAEAIMVGTVVGSAAGTSNVEDINSSVSLNVTNGMVRDFGGVAGALEDNTSKARTTMNRCRYTGTITLNDGKNDNRKAENVGGLVGELRSATIKNCLFDGTITAVAGANYSSVGGVVGKVGTADNSEMHRILSHGTITLNGYTADTHKSGIVVGSAEKTIYLYKNYHTAKNCTAGLDYIGPHIIDKKATASDEGATVGSTIKVDQLLGDSHDLTSDPDSLYKAGFRTLLGESNWAAVPQTTGRYTYPLKDPDHEPFYKNGFCTSGDGEYEKPNSMGKIYQIQNAGQLFWFAEHFNDPDGDIPQDAEVQILRDIDMEGDSYIYPGIGTSSKPFKGVFNGMSHKIQRYYRDIVNAEHTGLINNAVGATIEHFSIYGEVNFNLATIKSFHGTVLGMGINEYNDNKELVDSMLITDVYSFVNVNCKNAYTRVLGGIAGRTSGGVHRSRYSGTIQGMDNQPSASGRQIAGIVANAREKIIISDCLFDGTIKVTCQEADTMRVSGILASNEKNSGVKITIKNCLFNGCLQLNHTYEQGKDGTGVKSTENGVIAGYWDSNLPKFVNNVYYLKTCSSMEGIDIGQWEGKNQQTGSTMDTKKVEGTWNAETQKYEVTTTQWQEIFKALDEYEEVVDEKGEPVYGEDGKQLVNRNGNWEYDAETAGKEGEGGTEAIPVPGGHVCHHKNEDGTDAYDKYGYCTICGKAKPLEKDTDGKYKMTAVSDLASFRDMVNDGDIKEGTILNAKLTEDIDFEDYEGEFGKPIGNSNFNRYLYNFDGQGHKLLNVKIKTNDQFVGFFGFAGDDTHDCEIHDLTITGTIEASYDSKTNDDKPLYIGVVGKMYRGKVYNVHSELTMKNTNPTRAVLGGIVGCVDTPEGTDTEGNPLKVVIDKCSYTGTCIANAAGDMGGIVGQTSRYTEVSNCTFGGSLIHSYKGANNTTNFSGVVGKNTSPLFQGVKNCVIAGLLSTDADRQFVNYGEAGNHKNVLCGEDSVITVITQKAEASRTEADKTYLKQYSGNYAWNAYNGATGVPTNSIVTPTYLAMEKFVNGELCATLNANDDAPSDIQNGHPWGQILGYQLDLSKVTTGSFLGAHTTGSPAQRVPLPGYIAVKTGKDGDGNDVYTKTAYKVVKDGSNNYTADWYYFDDLGDDMPYPTDATSLSVKKVDYTRPAEYMSGYCSVCMPFDLDQSMMPADTCYQYKGIEGNKVLFEPITLSPIPAGTPFIMKYAGTESVAWTPYTKGADSTPTSIVFSPSASATETTGGLYGAFQTATIGANYYKLNSAGTAFSKTSAKGKIYPYRVYLALPKAEQGSSKAYTPLFLDDEGLTTNMRMEFVNAPDSGQRYNTLGQKVSKSAKGIIIINGKKYISK